MYVYIYVEFEAPRPCGRQAVVNLEATGSIPRLQHLDPKLRPLSTFQPESDYPKHHSKAPELQHSSRENGNLSSGVTKRALERLTRLYLKNPYPKVAYTKPARLVKKALRVTDT